jgi:hypothetical protein
VNTTVTVSQDLGSPKCATRRGNTAAVRLAFPADVLGNAAPVTRELAQSRAHRM